MSDFRFESSSPGVIILKDVPEDCHVYMRVTYRSTEEVEGVESLWYEGHWT